MPMIPVALLLLALFLHALPAGVLLVEAIDDPGRPGASHPVRAFLLGLMVREQPRRPGFARVYALAAVLLAVAAVLSFAQYDPRWASIGYAVLAGLTLLGAIAWSVPTGQPAAQDPGSPDTTA
ncbi:hypothetical protein [Streptomyces sp. CA-106110]|uniref:hypothetical protein n=1 Tax=Streptomyces sp. CA-106110 TaxID=3240044 RepID=UPI003D9411AA